MNIELDSTWSRYKRIAIEMHKQVALWYSYLVALSVTLQESWSQLDDYVPPKARHWVIGTATIIVIADKALQAARRVG